MVPTAEDVIVMKLRWFQIAKRGKDRDDVCNIIAVQGMRVRLLKVEVLEQLAGLGDYRELMAMPCESGASL